MSDLESILVWMIIAAAYELGPARFGCARDEELVTARWQLRCDFNAAQLIA